MNFFLKALVSIPSIVLLVLWTPIAVAQGGYPSRPVQVLVPFSPGAAADIVARALAEPLSTNMGQPIVIENRPGARGLVGVEIVAKSAPDGYRVLLYVGTLPTIWLAGQKLLDDFLPVSLLAVQYYAMVAKDSSSLKDLLERAHARPGRTTVGIFGAGETVFNVFSKESKEQFVAVAPSQGLPLAVMFDQVDCAIIPASSIATTQKTVKLIAVFSEKRIDQLRDIPTVREQGINQIAFISYGLMLPKGTPPDIVRRLQDFAVLAAKNSTFRELVAKTYLTAVPGTAEQFSSYLRTGLLAGQALPNSNDCSKCACQNKDEPCYKGCCTTN
jgi:tripartite-type tricarboxylate transporter receptor subunit TctC